MKPIQPLKSSAHISVISLSKTWSTKKKPVIPEARGIQIENLNIKKGLLVLSCRNIQTCTILHICSSISQHLPKSSCSWSSMQTLAQTSDILLVLSCRNIQTCTILHICSSISQHLPKSSCSWSSLQTLAQTSDKISAVKSRSSLCLSVGYPQLDNSKHGQWRNPGHKHNVQVTQMKATHNARKDHPKKHFITSCNIQIKPAKDRSGL